MADLQITFENFLDNVVNLNKTRVGRIKEAIRVLPEKIQNHENFKNLYIDAIAQGSFRQKTIIKPFGMNGSYDVDILISLRENTEWTPVDYLKHVADVFDDTDRYKNLTDTIGKTRCVTIDYEGDFHVDLVPAVMRGNDYYICNKSSNEFEKTDGDGYALWFERQNTAANDYLVPTVRLLKYLRDSQESFETKSIILTTLVGMQIQAGDRFESIPEALTNSLTRLNSFLSQFESPPTIANPANPEETFERHWKGDQAGYERLKSAINTYSELATKAQSSKPDESVKHWHKLFGDDFAKGLEEKEQEKDPSYSIRKPTIIKNPPKQWAK